MNKRLFTGRMCSCCVYPQSVQAPPHVQQQYLSSIQHLLGDGRIPMHATITLCQMCSSPPLTSCPRPPIQVWRSWWRWWRKRFRTHWEGECVNSVWPVCDRFNYYYSYRIKKSSFWIWCNKERASSWSKGKFDACQTHLSRPCWSSALCLQGVAEAESVSAGVGAAAELDQSRGGGRLRAAAVLVHALRWWERAFRPGLCTNTEQFTAGFTKRRARYLKPLLLLCRRVGWQKMMLWPLSS